jgi:hypothetical protein
MIWLLSLAKGILFFPLHVGQARNGIWTVMLFYKHLCLFWKRYIHACMHLFLFSYHRLFIIFLLLLLLLSFWYLLFVLIDRRKGKKPSFLLLLSFLSLSLSQPKILPASVYTHIYQSEEVRVLARRFFLLVLAKFGPDITTPDSSIRGCICLRTRIERAYIQKGIISGIYIYVCIYIYKSDVQF